MERVLLSAYIVNGSPSDGRHSGLLPGVVSGLVLGLAGSPLAWGPLVLVGLAPWLAWLSRGPSVRAAAISGFAVGALAYGIPFAFMTVAPIAHGAAIYIAGVGVLAASIGGVGALLACSRWLIAVAPLVFRTGDLGARRGASLPPGRRASLAASLPCARRRSLPGIGCQRGRRGRADRGRRCGQRRTGGGLAREALADGHGSRLARSHGTRGAARAPGGVEPSPIQGLRIAAAQPDLAPDAASRRASHQPILDDLVRLSQQAVAQRAELIIWPETAYEREVPPEGDAFLGVLSRSLGAPMLIGARRRTRPGVTRNAVILAEVTGESRTGDRQGVPASLGRTGSDGTLDAAARAKRDLDRLSRGR